ncbi:hypothetical protein Ana3638_19690 [Anaerocolumna sedimenticola]|uniref:Acetylglutamate kinase n=1 Tax=Anaerocolumna sedimenticola TaxID=2696063 RepID=A0A6P1TP10_9FIRM|nr:hypothetical protein [Anaerocolumna sedimenticola]QHQ62724.1 hypothetical protein Ana3638_19690 [Anaerocolumna sedimenticola]
MDRTNNTNSSFYSPEDLRNILRQLWNQYSVWIRFYIVSRMADLDDLEVLTNRLFEVPIDLYNVFRIYYGNNSAQEFENLLRDQITLTIQIIDEINTEQSIDTTESNWKANADQISLFLSQLNPYWNMQVLQNLFYNHLDMTIYEAQKRKYKQYAADVYEYNFIEYHTLMIADYIWNGIINQFYSNQ